MSLLPVTETILVMVAMVLHCTMSVVKMAVKRQKKLNNKSDSIATGRTFNQVVRDYNFFVDLYVYIYNLLSGQHGPLQTTIYVIWSLRLLLTLKHGHSL